MFLLMRLELAERLVCPSAHARTPLIVVAEETRERELLRGTAGCMACMREGRITDGSLRFAAENTGDDASQATRRGDVVNDAVSAGSTLDDDQLFRLVALLGLGEAGLPVLLAPSYAGAALPLVEQHDAMVVVFGSDAASPRGVAYVSGCEDAVPFADGSFHAAALDDTMTVSAAADAVRCVRVGGRVMAAASLPMPPRLRELARDAQHWVAEVQAPTVVVPLRRA